MNKEVYRLLYDEEIVTKDHYWFDYNDEFVLLPSNHPWIGKKVEYEYIYEKISLEDFRILKDDEIVNEEHFYFWRDDYCHTVMYRCYSGYHGDKASDVRKENNSLPEFNLYAKKETQINFGKFDFLKDIEL
jgi:hypothetical protein